MVTMKGILRGIGTALLLTPFYSINDLRWWILMVGMTLVLSSLDAWE